VGAKERLNMFLILSLIGAAMWYFGIGLVSLIGLIAAIGFGALFLFRVIALIAEVVGF
jgi:hypothetical protein